MARLVSSMGSFAAACVVTVLTGCGGGGNGGGGGGIATCGEPARKQWVLDVARDWYLFPELLPPTVDVGSYPTAEALLDGITATARAQGKDRFFSFLTTQAAENSLLGEGEFVGFGFRTRTDPGNRPFVLDVYSGSPAGMAGLLRGDEIVAVDQGAGFRPLSELLVNGMTLTDVLGPAEVGVRRGLRLVRDGTTHDVSMTKSILTLDPVPDDFGVSIMPLAGTTGVGYLHLRSYISTADPQLRAAFAQFRAQDLRNFVIDLRYNGGGLVSIAELIDNLLGGGRSTADIQFRLVHNATKAAQNSTSRFQPQAQSVGPVRIAFLTTGATASASEINVNAMRPWVEVAIVGADTLGKPVGQLAFDLNGCPDRLRLISFKVVNALEEGEYFDGLASTVAFACAADDTLASPLGDPGDNLTREALGWLATGACTTVMTAGGDALEKSTDALANPYPRPLQPSAVEHWLPGAT